MSRFLLLLVALLACAAFVAGCGATSTFGEEEMDLIEQVQNAPDLVRHAGVRRVESYYNLDGASDSLIYREQIQTNGLGRFAITPLGAVQGGLGSTVAFIALQRARQGFHQRYRDFLVRDLTAFLSNYQLKSAGSAVFIAGRECLQLEIARSDGSASYEVALDVQTGLVLRYREFDASGALYSMMEYESYDASPDLTGVVFHQESNQEQPLLSAASLGFQPLIPKLLPDSAFTFLEASSIVDPVLGTKMAKLTFTDGVETVFFVDAGPTVAPELTRAAPKTGAGVSAAGFVTGEGLPMADEVRAFHEGPLGVVWGNVAGHSLFLVGKATEAELLQMLESALP